MSGDSRTDHDAGRPLDSKPDAFERWRDRQERRTWAKKNLDDVAFGWNASRAEFEDQRLIRMANWWSDNRGWMRLVFWAAVLLASLTVNLWWPL